MRAARIADIGKRANALRRAGFYDADEVRQIAEWVRSGMALVDLELLLANAERLKHSESHGHEPSVALIEP